MALPKLHTHTHTQEKKYGKWNKIDSRLERPAGRCGDFFPPHNPAAPAGFRDGHRQWDLLQLACSLRQIPSTCRQYELYTGAGPSSSSSWSWSSFIVVKTDVSLKVCQEPKQRAVCGARNQHHPAGNDSRSMEYGMRCTAEIMRQTRKSKGTTYSDLFPGKWEDTNSNIF